MATLVALTGLGGEDVRVNPDTVVRLLAIPARQLALLAPGVASGTYVDQQDSEGQTATRTAVQGTVAATATALAATGSTARVTAMGLVSGAGVLQAGSVGIAGVVRNGVGDYTVTFTTAPTVPNGMSITPASGAAMAAQNGPLGATVQVLMFNDAGAAADESFGIVVFGS